MCFCWLKKKKVNSSARANSLACSGRWRAWDMSSLLTSGWNETSTCWVQITCPIFSISSRKRGSISPRKTSLCIVSKEPEVAGSGASVGCGCPPVPGGAAFSLWLAWPVAVELATEGPKISRFNKKASWHGGWGRAVQLINLLTLWKHFQKWTPVLCSCVSCIQFPALLQLLSPSPGGQHSNVTYACCVYGRDMSHLVPFLACHCDLLQ